METAKLLKIENTLGSIEAGKIADIIAVEGDPLDDISVLKDIVLVMKDGKVYK
jgi:imidazolonepropionase-like amidohydrolase